MTTSAASPGSPGVVSSSVIRPSVVRSKRGRYQATELSASSVAIRRVRGERGLRAPDSEHIEPLAAALDVLPSSLTDQSVATTTPMFRASGIGSKRDERRIEGRIEQARLAAARILDELVITPSGQRIGNGRPPKVLGA